MSVLRRLIAMRPAEILERSRQAVALRVDRLGLGPRVGHPPTPDSLAALHDRFRARSGRFFPGTHDLDATTAALRRLDPDDETRTLEAADAALEGRLTIFKMVHACGSPPDWSVDPVTEVRYPDVHWSRVDYLRPTVGGEYKVAWEIARHQHFLDLGRAWAYSRDERYAVAFADQVRDFTRTNPPGQGIHWASSLEVAFRAMSWIWALHLFRDSDTLTPALFGEVASSLAMHGRHIDCYLSTYFSPNTHLTGESLALFWIGSTLPELHGAEWWRQKAWQVLEEQLPIQVRPDGSYFEQSTAYARYNADFYLHLMVLCEQLEEPVPASMRKRLERALDALLAVTRPDGATPYFGDDDGGRLLPVDGRAPIDQRAPLGTGALLFARSDYRTVAASLSPETVWLLGPSAVDDFAAMPRTPPGHLSKSLPDGGFFVQRDGWGPDANMLMIDCGPLGTLNCGHAHADLLSVDVSVAGRSVLVDSGTFTYTSDPDARDRYRAGPAHNGLTVDGVGSSWPGGPFAWDRRTDGELVAWQERPDWCWFMGRERFHLEAAHDRGVLFLPGRGWVIVDGVQGLAGRNVELSFHLAPDLSAKERPDGGLDLTDDSGQTVAAIAWPDQPPLARVEDTWHSPSYRVAVPSRVIRVGTRVQEDFWSAAVLGAPQHIEELSGHVGRALALLQG